MSGVKWTLGLLISVILLFLSLGAAGKILAQEVTVGVRGGVNAAYAVFEDEVHGDREVRPGLLVGATFTYRLGSWTALQVEALYAEKGWTGALRVGGRTLGYLEVPVLLRLQRSGRLLPHVVFGPAFSYEVRCAFPDVPGMGDVDCDHPLVSLERPSTDVGILMGGGVGRRLGAGILWFDLHLNVGLRDIEREPLPRGAQRNIALSLSLAYTLGLGPEGGLARGGDRTVGPGGVAGAKSGGDRGEVR